MRRLVTVVALALLAVLPAGVAFADPAGPTNYRTVITDIRPAVEGVALEVYGGDSFLVLTVDPGVEVLVYGYAHDPDEGVLDPYLRFSADGTVEANRRSPSRWLNEDRYAAVEQPDFADPTAPPDWEVVGSGGTYAWHDHRIHWMSPALPPTIDPNGSVQQVYPEEQLVPFQVDGTEIEAAIILQWQPSPSPLPWVAIALVAAAFVAGVARRGMRTAAALVGAASVVALAVALGAVLGTPPGVGWTLPPVLLPVVALAAAGVALTREEDVARWILGASALPLIAWAIGQAGALTSPIVPSSVHVVGIRMAVALSAGVGVGVIVSALLAAFGGDLSSLADLADAEEGELSAG